MYPKWMTRGDGGSACLDGGSQVVTNDGDGGSNGIIPVKDD